MKIFVWILHGLLIFAFFMAGISKLTMPYAEMLAQMPWAEDFSLMQIRLIGAVELLGSLGMLLPIFVKQLPKKLIGYAGLGLALVMLGAIGTHTMRGEFFPPSIILFIMSAFVGWKRFNEYK